MSSVSNELFASCYEDARSGRRTVADCVAANPEVGPELGDLLELATSIASTPTAKPDPVFRLSGRATLLQAIAPDRRGSGASWVLRRLFGPLAGAPASPFPASGLRRAAMPVALALALSLTLAGGGATYAAQGSFPGEPLYGVKLLSEDARLQLAPSDLNRARLHLELAGTRLAEMERLAAQNRLVQAGGLVEAYVAQLAGAEQSAEAVSFGDEQTRQQELALLRTLLQGQEERLAKLQSDARTDFVPGLARAAERARGLPAVAEARWHVGLGHLKDSSSSQPSGVPAEETVPASLTQLDQAVEALAGEPLLPGASHKSLLAKIESAEDAIARGQPAVALNVLAAFENELEAFHRDGRVSDATYHRLLSLNNQAASALKQQATPAASDQVPDPQNERRVTPPGQDREKKYDPEDKNQGRKP